jgi:deazaflavin-dependent oxidoreductase (nitroreductase family)
MDDPIRRALTRGGLIDITTTGRRTGQPRRVEIVYHAIDGRIYISGRPSHSKRGWIANLEANPGLTFHMKGRGGGPVADLPASARVIEDEAERRAILGHIVANAWQGMDLEAMVGHSPLIEVTFEALAA